MRYLLFIGFFIYSYCASAQSFLDQYNGDSCAHLTNLLTDDSLVFDLVVDQYVPWDLGDEIRTNTFYRSRLGVFYIHSQTDVYLYLYGGDATSPKILLQNVTVEYAMDVINLSHSLLQKNN